MNQLARSADPGVHHGLVAANDSAPPAPRRRWLVEADRHGVFLATRRRDLYLRLDSESGWWVQREEGSLEMRLWRLHLLLDRAPARSG